MNKFKVFETKEEAKKYAIKTYGADQVEFQVVNVVKVYSTMAKYYGCKEGYAVDKEMTEE